MLKRIHTRSLEVAFEESGRADAPVVVLLHGFPYDVRAYDDVAARLAPDCRVLVPYLRGFGPTRFLSPDAPRSGQQAALGADLLGVLDALHVDRAIVGGYDWGGRAACIVAALWPERVRGLVSVGGVQHPGACPGDGTARARGRAPLLVPVLLPLGAGASRPRAEPAGLLPAPLAALVPHLGVLRRDLRAHRGLVRLARIRRRRHSLVPAPVRADSRGSCARGRRAEARGPAGHRRSRSHPRRRR